MYNAGVVVVNSEVVHGIGHLGDCCWGGKVCTDLKCAISSLRNTFKLAYIWRSGRRNRFR
jgi:hypothetical protein